ncbi:MAG: recombinase family protein [Oscillospiraceae bacterium]|nr:recombinase family protein [Oscillospiraceae bacterium]
MEIKVIRAKRRRDTNNQEKPNKIRVAAYARVSTDDQDGSYESQITHYTSVIKNNPNWEFAGMFADEGISGTQADTRPGFKKMINLCESGKVDIVITKSISRFARNTIDCLTYIRKLKSLGVAVLFEKENVNTLEASGELLITILASMAQQESESISKNTKMGIEFGFQNGIGRLNTSIFLGLDPGEQRGEYVINPEQAIIARRIYREYLEGYSPGMIADRLNKSHTITASGKGQWYASAVSSILSNEKYCGDMLLQKYYVEDFLTHKTIKNTGQLPQYYVKDHHEPIVPREVFTLTQEEVLRRGSLKNDPTKIRFGSTIALGRRLICPYCNRALKRVKREGKIEWRCRYQSGKVSTKRFSKNSRCGCRVILESEAERSIVIALNSLPSYRENLIMLYSEIENGDKSEINSALEKFHDSISRKEEEIVQFEKDGNEKGADDLDREITSLRCDERRLIVQRAEYSYRELQIQFLLELLDEMKLDSDEKEEPELHGACYNYDDFFRWTKHELPEGLILNGRITRFDNDLVIRYLENVTVLDDGLEVKFKAGITVKV